MPRKILAQLTASDSITSNTPSHLILMVFAVHKVRPVARMMAIVTLGETQCALLAWYR